MIRLIMSDLDGTLLDEQGNLPPGFDAVMDELRARRILFAPASGRQYYTLLRQFPAYEHEFVFLAENGACVMYRGETLFSAAMAAADVRETLRIAAAVPQAQAVLCGRAGAYILSDENEAFMREIRKYYARCRFVESFAQVEDEILKIAICDLSEGGAEFNAYPHFAGQAGRMKLALSGRLWMDIMDPAVNKGVGAAKVQEKLAIAPAECMAFGDYMNDAEMMSAARYSYAVANAHPEIKRIARFSARSNREYGVLLAIREMLAGRLDE